MSRGVCRRIFRTCLVLWWVILVDMAIEPSDDKKVARYFYGTSIKKINTVSEPRILPISTVKVQRAATAVFSSLVERLMRVDRNDMARISGIARPSE